MRQHVFLVPETLYQRLQSRTYTSGRGGWQTIVRELRACEMDGEVDQLAEIKAKARAEGVAEGRIQGIELSIQTLRDLQVAEENEG